MRIKINLEYVLAKNKMSLSDFLSKNKISTYSQLLEFCDERNMNPVEESNFNSAVKTMPAKISIEKETIVDESPKKETKRVKSGTASKTQTKKRSRASSKKVKTS